MWGFVWKNISAWSDTTMLMFIFFKNCGPQINTCCKPGGVQLLSVNQGWGLLSQFPLFRYFPNFSASPKYMLANVYPVHIWQVLTQLSCSDTCQIWMWCKWSNRYFCKIENSAYGEINERSFSNPHPWPQDNGQRSVDMHYPDVTWASWRLKSPET